ncbi:MAG: radical SAM protein [Promethearchaeota archaeon]
MTVEKIRVSIGSAAVLGLIKNKGYEEIPTTCYCMTYIEGHCVANCGFCPQARDSEGSTEFLSRITWPIFEFKEFLTKLNYMPPPKRFKRICIQTLNYKQNFSDLVEIISQIRTNSNIPISTAIPPMEKSRLKELKLIGVDRIGIALDGSTEEIFEAIKGKGVSGPYNWNKHLQSLKGALEIFSEGQVTTHLIIGLGETQQQILELIQDLFNLKIKVSLFAFTPIKGTKLQNKLRPDLIGFRKIQLGRYLIMNEIKKASDFTFNIKGDLIKFNLNQYDLLNIIENSDAFMTTGCPGCNRPYYTSTPSGPMYNFPRKLMIMEQEEIYQSLLKFL